MFERGEKRRDAPERLLYTHKKNGVVRVSLMNPSMLADKLIFLETLLTCRSCAGLRRAPDRVMRSSISIHGVDRSGWADAEGLRKLGNWRAKVIKRRSIQKGDIGVSR